MAALPTFAWQQKGFDDEMTRQRDLRSKTRRELQELADLAAMNGQEMDLDTWNKMVTEQVGSDAFLYGGRPSGTLLETMRQSTNKKAQEVQRRQQFEQFKAETEKDRLAESYILEVASGKPDISDSEIQQNLTERFGPEFAARLAPRVPSIRQKRDMADYAEGLRVGQTMTTQEEVDELLKGGTMSKRMAEGIKIGAQRKMDELERNNYQTYQSIISKLPPTGYEDEGAARAAIETMIPEYMQRDPKEKALHVDRALKFWKASKKIEQTGRDVAVGRTEQDITQRTTPEVEMRIAAVRQQEAETNRRIAQAANESHDKAMRTHLEEVDGLFKGMKLKPAQQEQAMQIKAFLSQYEPDNKAELIAAVMGGDEGQIRQAFNAARNRADPISYKIGLARNNALITSGQMFTGNPVADYQNATSFGAREFDAEAAKAGADFARLKSMGGNDLRLRTEHLDPLIDGVAAGVKQMRSMLAQSGKFAASAEQLAKMEEQLIRQRLAPMVKAAGLPPAALEAFVDAAVQKAGSPNSVTSSPAGSEMLQTQLDQRRARVGLPPVGGTPQQQPRGAPPNQSGWWRQ
jgi:hypothetical protein